MRKPTLVLLSMLALALALPAPAAAADRDRDRLPDRWEERHGLSPTKKSRNFDPDRDHVDNANEYRERTDPRDKDSDNDGKGDGREDADRDKLNNRSEDVTGNDPRDKDSDDDGILDGHERAGVVVSFEDDELTIDLANGGSLSGYVTDWTELACHSEAQAEKSHGDDETKDESDIPEDPVDDGSGDDPVLDEDPIGDDFLAARIDGFEDPPAQEDVKEETVEDEFKYDEPKDKCSTDDLKPGAAVHEARLDLTADGLIFKSVVLLR